MTEQLTKSAKSGVVNCGMKTKRYDCELVGDFRSDVMLDIARKAGVFGGMSHSTDPETGHATLTESRIGIRLFGTADDCLGQLHEFARAYGCTNYEAKVCEYVCID